MNFHNNIPNERSAQRKLQLQGPRPTPLSINKNSHKIKKPPLGPEVQIRKPVIIYTVSPKIIHTTPNEFMSLVQRLTGSSNSSSNMVSMSNDSLNNNSSCETTTLAGTPYPKIEKDGDQPNQEIKKHHQSENSGDIFHGIFSPSSLLSSSMVEFINDLNPNLPHNKSCIENSFIMQSPSNFISLSPCTPPIDLFNKFLD